MLTLKKIKEIWARNPAEDSLLSKTDINSSGDDPVLPAVDSVTGEQSVKVQLDYVSDPNSGDLRITQVGTE